MTAVQDAHELVVHTDGTVWERWYERADGWHQARAVYFTDDAVISSLPDLLMEDAPSPVHRASGRPLAGCRWATPADTAGHDGPVREALPAQRTEPGVLVADEEPPFLAVSCSTERARVLIDLGHRDYPGAPVTTLTISVDTANAIELFRGLSGALRYLGVDTDALYPGNVTMTRRR